MGKIQYTEQKMQRIHGRVRRLIKIVNEMENDFPGRHFSLDGHLVGSIGEVIATYHYGIKLYKASEPAHDGEVGSRRVQIKITQQNNIVINHEPDYLIVLYLNKNGNVYEVYNGPGKEPWDSASKRDSHNNRHMLVSKLMKLDEKVDGRRRIRQKHAMEKMKTEYKNK